MSETEAAKKKLKSPDIRDRVVEFKRIPAADLQDNAGNWRTHPQAQRDAFRAVAVRVGVAGALLAYHSKRAGGALVVIDGHMRKGEYPDFEWPVLVTDLNDEEADLVLATYDPLAAMAEANAAQLTALMVAIKDDVPEDMSPLLAQLIEQVDDAMEEALAELRGGGPVADVNVAEEYLVLIECEDEEQQVTLLNRLHAEGYSCRALL